MSPKRPLAVLTVVTALAFAHESRAQSQPATDIGVPPGQSTLPPSQQAQPYPQQYQQPQPYPQYQYQYPYQEPQPYPQYQRTYRPRPPRYHEGDPIPPGYHVEDKPRMGLVITGWVLFLVPYALGAFTAVATDFENKSAWLTAPVIGPWALIGQRHYLGCHRNGDVGDGLGCAADTLVVTGLILSGIMQTLGATFLLIGYSATKPELVRDDRALRVHPMPVGSGYGLGLGAAF
jgi:hypothetical protein